MGNIICEKEKLQKQKKIGMKEEREEKFLFQAKWDWSDLEEFQSNFPNYQNFLNWKE